MTPRTKDEELRIRARRVDEITRTAALEAIDRRVNREATAEDREWDRTVGPYLADLDAAREAAFDERLADLDDAWDGRLSGRAVSWPTWGE